MSVYIKGRKPPNSCDDCWVSDCPNAEHIDGYRMMDRPTYCPLVPVPPHGRLIDADKQDAQIEALIERHLHGYTKSTWDFICELRDILKRNPTVIQKDSAEEEKNDK